MLRGAAAEEHGTRLASTRQFSCNSQPFWNFDAALRAGRDSSPASSKAGCQERHVTAVQPTRAERFMAMIMPLVLQRIHHVHLCRMQNATVSCIPVPLAGQRVRQASASRSSPVPAD